MPPGRSLRCHDGRHPHTGRDAAHPPATPTVTVIGIADDRLDLLSPEARQALAEAEVVVGGRRQLWLWQTWPGRPAVGPGGWSPETIEVGEDLTELARLVRQRAMDASRRVCVLPRATRDFSGSSRTLVQMVDRRALRVLPAPSSVSLAFARLGLPWDDTLVVAAHGRAAADLASHLRTVPKAAVLTSPETPTRGHRARPARSRGGDGPGGGVQPAGVGGRGGGRGRPWASWRRPASTPSRWSSCWARAACRWSAGRPEPASTAGGHAGGRRSRPGTGTTAGMPVSAQVLAWGLPDSAFAHRAGSIAKAEVRSVVLGKLALPAAGVLWDVGGGQRQRRASSARWCGPG